MYVCVQNIMLSLSHKQLMDIQLLCSPSDYAQLKRYADLNVPVAMPLISKYLNGIGRAVILSTNVESGLLYNCKPVKMIEGEIKKGQFSGFSRQITAKGSCQIGYWKPFNSEATTNPLPNGKWAAFNSDGSARIPFGLYAGVKDKANILVSRIETKQNPERSFM